MREFADNALDYVHGMMHKLTAAGEFCELYNIHGHYADAGEAAALMSYTLGVDMVMTGHSLGRNKLDHLLKSGECSANKQSSEQQQHNSPGSTVTCILTAVAPCKQLQVLHM